MPRLPIIDTEYVKVPVTDWPAGVDVTTLRVSLAFTSPDERPEPSSATVGSWEPGGPFLVNGKQTQYARILVGPANSGLALSAGEYVVWVRIESDPEVPFKPAPGRVIVG